MKVHKDLRQNKTRLRCRARDLGWSAQHWRAGETDTSSGRPRGSTESKPGTAGGQSEGRTEAEPETSGGRTLEVRQEAGGEDGSPPKFGQEAAQELGLLQLRRSACSDWLSGVSVGTANWESRAGVGCATD